MTIANVSEEDFKLVLKQELTPSKAISDPNQLRGRADKLRQIERAFNSDGRHIFVHGDRGVGKTSLAQSAAIVQQSSEKTPILIACDQESDFFTLINDMLKKCLPAEDVVKKKKSDSKTKLTIPGISHEVGSGIEHGIVPVPTSINDAVMLTKYISQFHSKSPVIIIDEFDQLASEKEKKYFADFIKQISDQEIPIKFIFCGIGRSLDELIGVHLSTDRYIHPVALERLSHDARWAIMQSALDRLNIGIPENIKIRIGQISDGFPYYVHFITEMILWQVFDDESDISIISSDQYTKGVRAAINESQTTLRFAYEKATQKYSDDYQEVLWAVADSLILRRQTTKIYEESYTPIMKLRPDRKFLTKPQFHSRMNQLKNERHGSILTSFGAGWYEFTENVVRGYVRLRAEDAGIELGRDHF